jgi:hypothetical protein
MDPDSAHTLPMLLSDVPPSADDGFPRERLFNIMKANIYITQVSIIRSGRSQDRTELALTPTASFTVHGPTIQG